MSDRSFTDLVAEVARATSARSSGFVPALFEELAWGPGASVYESTGDLPAARGYLTILAEAVSEGYVSSNVPAGFVSSCLLELLAKDLPKVAASERLACLVRAFNLCEGVADEPRWLDQYLAARLVKLEGGIQALPKFLERELASVLAPPRAATFDAPFKTTVLDPRSVDDDFLPGEMVLAAPNVVTIRDRKRDVWIGAILAPGQQHRLFGPVRAEAQRVEPSATAKEITVGNGFVFVGDSRVELPRFGRLHAHAIAPAGFVLASAVDSQRIWVVEAAE
ncbi:MAG: hypothetical protein HY791_09860 [Deltaproteobacteria bacterium]|nr:hypothetical protein [Deltaproteobacteria bacterium]